MRNRGGDNFSGHEPDEKLVLRLMDSVREHRKDSGSFGEAISKALSGYSGARKRELRSKIGKAFGDRSGNMNTRAETRESAPPKSERPKDPGAEQQDMFGRGSSSPYY